MILLPIEAQVQSVPHTGWNEMKNSFTFGTGNMFDAFTSQMYYESRTAYSTTYIIHTHTNNFSVRGNIFIKLDFFSLLSFSFLFFSFLFFAKHISSAYFTRRTVYSKYKKKRRKKNCTHTHTHTTQRRMFIDSTTSEKVNQRSTRLSE